MPRKQHKYHFIYKTTCLLNEKYYVGMHSTSDLEDGYLGSGKRLRYSINKYGKENFKREILEFYNTRDLLKKREEELVNDDLLKDTLCINLKIGGQGGFCDDSHRKKYSIAGNNAFRERLKNDKNLLEYYQKNGKSFFLECWKNGRFKQYDWNGQHHTKETKEKIGKSNAISQLGLKNSQYGKQWIYNSDLKISLSIKKDLLNEYLANGWNKGRKIKF